MYSHSNPRPFRPPGHFRRCLEQTQHLSVVQLELQRKLPRIARTGVGERHQCCSQTQRQGFNPLFGRT